MGYNTRLAASRQIGVIPALGVWAALCLAGGLYAAREGYAGRSFAALLTFFCFSFGVMLFFAARGVIEKLSSKGGAGSGLLLGTLIFLAYIIYAFGTGSFSVARATTMAAFVFVPLALAISARGAAAGSWHDFLILAGVWTFVKFGPSKWLWLYPGGRLSYVFTVLVAVNVAIAVFLLVRRVNGVGYSIGWGPRWGLFIAASFVVFSCIAIVLGIKMQFIVFAPRWYEWRLQIPLALGILLFTAWPEEVVFRGLLQNLLSKASKSDFAGWWTASMLFGLSHITNMGFPNWKYVVLAAIAGLFYGWTWRKTGSIFASAIVHALVDALWHFLFRTV